MNANELLFYLRGFTELVDSPSNAQWTALRNEILRAKPVESQLIPIPMSNPTLDPLTPCDCHKTGRGSKQETLHGQ